MDPDVYLVSFRGTNQLLTLFSTGFFPLPFWAFLGKESSKTHPKYFTQHMQCMDPIVENFLHKNRMSLSPRFFFIAFWSVSRYPGKGSTTNVKSFQQQFHVKNKLPKIDPKQMFFSFFLIAFFYVLGH
jgi:hypothetical protein